MVADKQIAICLSAISCPIEYPEAGELLYFLADREAKKVRLMASLTHWRQDQPFISISYGHHAEHAHFVECLLAHVFPEQLSDIRRYRKI